VDQAHFGTAAAPAYGGAEQGQFGTVAAPAARADVVWRYGHRVLFGANAKWLPPYRIVPSFVTADGQTVVYRRRSQVILTETGDEAAAGTRATTIALNGYECKVRIDQYGFARLVRPARSQHADPLANSVEGAADMERDAALAVCKHLNEHIEGIGAAHRWTPSPDEQLVPVSIRPFAEPQPDAPRPRPAPDGKGEPRVRRSEMNDYLDLRAAWLARRFAWENGQRALRERAARAAQGDMAAIHEHLRACLHDVLWPAPVRSAYQLDSTTEVRLEFLVPGFDVLPEREAAIANGNRVAVQRMSEINRSRLFARHAIGLVLRMLGEVFAALPTVQRVTATALQQLDHRPPRYIASARVDRDTWTLAYGEGRVTVENPEPPLMAFGGRVNLTGLGAFLAIQPFR
jgi:hypothetical protein